MRDGWSEVSLGDVLRLEYGRALPERVRYGAEYPVYGSAGLVGRHAEAITPAGPAIIVGRKGTAGAVHWSDGPCWPIDTTYFVRLVGPLTPRFAYLLLQFIDLETVTAQTGVPGLNRDRAYDVRCVLPPLAEQRRIVDLIGAMDEAVEAADRESTATWNALSAFLVGSTPAPNNSGSPINALLALGIGGVWGSEAGVDECDVAIYRSTEFSADGWANPSTAALRSVSERQMKSRALRGGDILLEKSGGTPTRPVGRVVRCREPSQPAVMSNFVQLLRPDSAVAEPSFLFWTLWSWHRRGVPAEYQTATTNIRNLRTREYLGLRVDLPPRVAQQHISAAADALQDVAIRAATTRDALKRLRSSVLADLLSGSHSIPTSYDRILGDAA